MGKETTADYIDRHIVEALVEVAKQKMYSEEEVLEHLNHLNTMSSSKLDLYTDNDEMITAKWFEQFKKK